MASAPNSAARYTDFNDRQLVAIMAESPRTREFMHNHPAKLLVRRTFSADVFRQTRMRRSGDWRMEFLGASSDALAHVVIRYDAPGLQQRNDAMREFCRRRRRRVEHEVGDLRRLVW